MISDEVSSLNSAETSKTSLYIFFLILSVYLFTGQGSVQSTDGRIMFYLTQSMVEQGKVSFTEQVFSGGPAGEQYSKYGIGMSLLAVPFYLLGKLLSFLFDIESRFTTLFCVGMMNTLISALTGLLIYRFARDRFRWSNPTASVLSLGFALSTIAWVYSEEFMSEPATTLLILGAAYLITDPSGKSSPLVWAGVLLGLAVTCRLATLVAVPGFLIYWVLASKDPEGNSRIPLMRGIARLVLPVLFFLGLIFIYNYVRFQNILDTGYEQGFQIHFLTGLFGILFSSGKSIFLYNPLVIPGCLALPLFYKTLPRKFFLFSWIVLSHLLLFSFWQSWHGGMSWGPRLMLVTLPYLVLAAGYLLEDGRKHFRALVIGTAVLGILIQIPSVTVSISRYYYHMRHEHQDRGHDLLLYSPGYSPLIGQIKQAGTVLKNLSDTVRMEKMADLARSGENFLGKSDKDILETGLSVNAPNFWWYYTHLFGYPFYLTFLPAAMLFAGAGFFGYKVYSTQQNEPVLKPGLKELS